MVEITKLGTICKLNASFEHVETLVADALKSEGFGILTEIDVKETLKKKLGMIFRPYKILGACNPALAHQALSAAPEVGLLLPCNVTVSQEEDGSIQVSFVNPLAMLGIVQNPELEAIATEAQERLGRVANLLVTMSPSD